MFYFLEEIIKFGESAVTLKILMYCLMNNICLVKLISN